MSVLAELLGHEPPLRTTTPIENQEESMDAEPNHWIAALIALAVLAGIAVIVAGIFYGGAWRWASGAVALIGIAAIVAPGFINDNKGDSGDG